MNDLKKNNPTTIPPQNSCNSNNDCSNGQICFKNKCIVPPVNVYDPNVDVVYDPYIHVDNNNQSTEKNDGSKGSACLVNADCQSGLSCLTNSTQNGFICLPPGTGTLKTVCKDGSDCMNGLDCYEQRCIVPLPRGEVGDECPRGTDIDCKQGLYCGLNNKCQINTTINKKGIFSNNRTSKKYLVNKSFY